MRCATQELRASPPGDTPRGPYWTPIWGPDSVPIDKKGAKQKKRKADFSAAHAHLDSVRLAWRNDVMHPKESYSEEEAQQLLYSVRTFMQHLTEILK